MPIYRSLAGIPELSGMSRPERRRVFDECCRRHMLNARVQRWSLAAFVAMMLLPVLTVAIADHYLGLDRWVPLGWFVAAAPGTLLGWLTLSRIAMNCLRPRFAESRSAARTETD